MQSDMPYTLLREGFMMKNEKALLIVDMQIMPFIWKDYGGKPLYKEEELIARVNGLIDRARESGTPIIYIMHTEKDGHRVEGAQLWQVHPMIKKSDGDIQIIKYHADSFYDTNLEEQLKTLGIRNLVICGLQTEFCIDTLCRTAYSKRYGVELVSDGHSTYDSEHMNAETILKHHNTTLEQFASILTCDEIKFI